MAQYQLKPPVVDALQMPSESFDSTAFDIILKWLMPRLGFKVSIMRDSNFAASIYRVRYETANKQLESVTVTFSDWLVYSKDTKTLTVLSDEKFKLRYEKVSG